MSAPVKQELLTLTTATQLVHRYTGMDYSVELKAEEYRTQDFTEDSFYIYPRESLHLVAVGFRDVLSKVNIFHLTVATAIIASFHLSTGIKCLPFFTQSNM